MRTRLSRTVAVLLAALACCAAPAAASPMEFGVHGGLSMASYFWAAGDSWNEFTLQVYHPDLSIYVAIPFSTTMALQVEAGYAGRGASIEATAEHLRWYFDYVEVPVILRFSEQTGATRLYAGGGGYAAAMLHGAYDFSSPSEGLSGTGDLVLDGASAEDHARVLDYGMVLVAGIGGKNAYGELRFSIGVTPVLDFTLTDGVERRALNADIQLLAGYHL